MSLRFKTEDWAAVWIGMLVCLLAFLAVAGKDVLGWAVATSEWLDVTKAMAPVSRTYVALPGIVSLFLTYLFLLALMSGGALMLGLRLGRFIASFSIIFWVSYVCWLAGHNAYIAATPNKLKNFGIAWSLGLTGEAGFVLALVAGLIMGNLFPARRVG